MTEDLQFGTKVKTKYSGEIIKLADRAPEFDDYSENYYGKAYHTIGGGWLAESQFEVVPTLSELLSECTPENAHEEVDWGSPYPVKVGFKRLNDEAILPTKAHPTDSGFDLYAAEDVIIEPGETKVIPTGIAVELPAGYEAQVRPRSGVTAKTKLRVQLGTIDNGYTGGIGAIVDNASTPSGSLVSGYKMIDEVFQLDSRVYCDERTYGISKGDRIAQLVIQPLPAVEAYEIEGDIEESSRGEKGFGSSGV